MVPIDLTEAERSAEIHMPSEHVQCFFLISPRRKKLVGGSFHREGQVVGAEHPCIANVGLANKDFVVRKENRRAADVLAVFVVVWKFPLVAGDQAVFEAILSFEMRQYVSGEAAKGPDLEDGGGAGQLLCR